MKWFLTPSSLPLLFSSFFFFVELFSFFLYSFPFFILSSSWVTTLMSVPWEQSVQNWLPSSVSAESWDAERYSLSSRDFATFVQLYSVVFRFCPFYMGFLSVSLSSIASLEDVESSSPASGFHESFHPLAASLFVSPSLAFHRTVSPRDAQSFRFCVSQRESLSHDVFLSILSQEHVPSSGVKELQEVFV